MADPYGRDQTFTGPTSTNMGPITDQELETLKRVSPSRQKQLEQRAYQSYIEALNRLRAAEAAGNPNAMGMSGAADAQNRLNAIRQPMGSGSTTDAEFEAYQNAITNQIRPRMRPIGSGSTTDAEMRTYTYEVDGRPVQMTQEEMMRAVQSGQITPGQAATMSTGVADPTVNAASDADMGALKNLPEDITDLGSFLRNLQQKGNAQWVKSRIVEPTSWIAVGVGSIIISIVVPSAAVYLLIAAAVTVALGIFMKEKGNG